MKTARLVLIVICALALLALAGCGCGKVREVAPAVKMANDARDGKMTVTNEKGEKATVETDTQGDKSGKTTVTTKEGTTTSEYGADVVTEKDVGIAFYPGATAEHGSKTTSSGGQGADTLTGVSLLTTDSFEDVVKFYKDKYAAGNTVMEQPDHFMVTINSGENSGKIIMVQFDASVNKIRINIMAGGKQ